MSTKTEFTDSFKIFAVRDIIKFVVYLKLGHYLDLVSFTELAWYMAQKNKKYNKLSMEEFANLFNAIDNMSYRSWKVRAVNNRWIYLE